MNLTRKHKEEDLRKRCLKKNFQHHLDSVKRMRPKQWDAGDLMLTPPAVISQDPSSSKLSDLKQMCSSENKQQIGRMSRKRPLENSSSLPPRKKPKAELTKHAPKKNKPFGTLTELPRVQVSGTQKFNPIPEDVLSVYLETQQILDFAESDIKSFFVIEELKQGSAERIKRPIRTTIAEGIVFEEVNNFQRRHLYKKIYNARLKQIKELGTAIEKSNSYLSLLRKTIQTLPIYSDHVPKLISTFNKVFLAYKSLPAHHTITVAGQQTELIKLLLKKFNMKHGLTCRSTPLEELNVQFDLSMDMLS